MAKRPLGLIRSRSNPCSASLPNLARHAIVRAYAQGNTVPFFPKHRLEQRYRRSFTLLTLGITGGWIFGNLWLPVQAATMINNAGLEFEQDTTVNSNFLESHGAYQSTFGVMDLETNAKTPLIIETRSSDQAESIFKPSTLRSHIGTEIDFRGTPGNTVSSPTAQFTFKANKRYVLYLESSYNGRPTGILYSTDILNPNREQQAKFTGGASDLCSSGVTVNWDDTGSKLVRNREQQDRDFDDFIVEFKGAACAIGGGEPPPIVSQAPPPPSVGALPPVAAGGRFSWEPLLLLAALPFIGGGDRDRSQPPIFQPPGGPNPNPSPNPPGLNPSPSPNPPGPNPPPPKCPSGNCQTIPEPMTILGSGTAIAFGALIQRRRKRKEISRSQPDQQS